jgi:hypothetical protein
MLQKTEDLDKILLKKLKQEGYPKEERDWSQREQE